MNFPCCTAINATAKSRAYCLLQHFGRFGAPRQLRSHRGPLSIAEAIKEFLTLVGVERKQYLG